MIRTALVALFLFGFFVISLPVYAFLYFLETVNAPLAGRIAQNIVCKALLTVERISGVRVEAVGIENIPKDEPVLYIGNHRSYFDIVATYPIIPQRVSYVAKKEIDKVPLLKYWMKYLKGLTFDRDDPRSGLNMIKEAIEGIKAGRSIFIFPEGTRAKGGELLEFKAGSFKVATRTGCAIVPVAISGTNAVFERQQPAIRPSAVRSVFGEAIRPADLSPEDRKHIAAFVKGRIEVLLEE